MNKYAYVGSTPVTVKGVGLVMPGQVVQSKQPIINQMFEPIYDQVVTNKISKKKRK